MADAASAALPDPADAEHMIFMLSSPIHTDLALPLSPDLAKRFGFMAADGLDPSQSGVSYIIVGWGGRSFYIETPTWSDLKPGPLFRALTLDRSVMHVGLAGAIDPAHPSVLAINLDGPAYERLLDLVLADFTGIETAGSGVVAGAQYGEYDLFYEADGWFNAAVGCNLWTARMLRQAELKTGWWTPLPGLLAASLRLHNPAGSFAYNPVAR
ncbi:TIGR02117 family protein [Hoeflea algicola]